MTTIQQVIAGLSVENTQTEIGQMLGISYSMVSRYKTSYHPSLEVAKRWYKLTEEVLHPFAEESLIKEIEDERIARKNTTVGKR